LSARWARLSVARWVVTPLCLFTMSCGLPIDKGKPGFWIENRRSTPITYTVDDTAHNTDESQVVGPEEVKPNAKAYVLTDACRGTGAHATDAQGVEIARLSTPLCQGDQWIFEADGTVRVERAH
jgi:hypothetical protein